jgi:ribonuclease HI
MQIVTDELLNLGVDRENNINESQLTLLDIQEIEREDWYATALGKELSDARAELFVLLQGVQSITIQERIIQNYKNLQNFRKKKSSVEIENSGEDENSDVTIYCDGGCTPNPGKSGSGVALYRDAKLAELWYGLYEEMGTNNTAELGALYESLQLAQKECNKGNKVDIKCDSMYSINCIKTWAVSWEKKGWTKKGGEIKNLEIIKCCYALYNSIKEKITLTHIKAHAGYEGNELADRMTMYAIKQKTTSFVQYTEEIDISKILSMRAG